MTLAAVTLAAVTLAAVTLAAGTEKASLFFEAYLKVSILSAEAGRSNCTKTFRKFSGNARGAAVTLAAVSSAVVTLTAVTLAAVTLAAGIEKVYSFKTCFKVSILSAEAGWSRRL